MILSGKEIIKQVKLGNIFIDPFIEKDVNPNSYNYRLGEQYVPVSAVPILEDNFGTDILRTIPEDGLLLQPGKVYLSHTHEKMGSNKFVTELIGRSSIGRLGLFLQLHADLGNLGPAHKWTLELTCVQPIIVYPKMKIGQVSFWIPEGFIFEYEGKYTDYNQSQSKHIIPSSFFSCFIR